MKIRWTVAARQDRAEIIEYIAIENPLAALKMDELFSAAADRLKDFPKIGRTGRIAGTRELFPHSSYRLVYEIEGDTVWVLTVVHTARQWPPAAESEAT